MADFSLLQNMANQQRSYREAPTSNPFSAAKKKRMHMGKKGEKEVHGKPKARRSSYGYSNDVVRSSYTVFSNALAPFSSRTQSTY